MDCAKGINFVHSCGGEISDYCGVGKASSPLLPMIAVPTTAGTGSETQSFALIADEKTGLKMACGDKRAACRVAILDPRVTVSQPALVTAATGIDAVSHAVETFVTRPWNSISRAFSFQAWKLLEANFDKVIDEPEDIDARTGMQIGAALAGFAIENSMLGAAHAAANPLTARFGIVHGEAVGVMLPHVARFNGAAVAGEYTELARTAQGCSQASAEGLAVRLEALLEKSGLPTRLTHWEVPEDCLAELARQASRQWTAQFNPREVEPADFVELYKAAFS